jgi:tight adherence protein B
MAAMRDLSDISGYLILVLVFVAALLLFFFLFLTVARRAARRDDLSRRLSKSELPREHDVLVKTRRRRSLSADGNYTMPMVWLNRLIVQSGLTLGASAVPLAMVTLCLGFAALVLALSSNLIVAAAAGVALGGGFPLLVLVAIRSRRLRKFEALLPEAIETLVRGLKAGHPISAAIRMVVRELPDPIGTEFTIVADELTYGLDLETAMGNVSKRVGQKDLALLVVAIGIHARSGGNLAELLAGISKVIRDRLRMRLKVKALSAEGRFSALLLSLLPFALFGILAIIAPTFYGEIWGMPLVKPMLIGATVWMLIGDLIMYRMVTFEI